MVCRTMPRVEQPFCYYGDRAKYGFKEPAAVVDLQYSLLLGTHFTSNCNCSMRH